MPTESYASKLKNKIKDIFHHNTDSQMDQYRMQQEMRDNRLSVPVYAEKNQSVQRHIPATPVMGNSVSQQALWSVATSANTGKNLMLEQQAEKR